MSLHSQLFLLVAALFLGCNSNHDLDPIDIPASGPFSNIVTEDRMLLVLKAPSVHNGYYARTFEEIIDFQVSYANAILGNDNVVILADEDTRTYLTGRVPEDIILEAEVDDIWMRDFTTVNPLNPIGFTYTTASVPQYMSEQIQNSWRSFAQANDVEFVHSSLMLDGGNVVDNYAGRAITTTRFMEDNQLTKAEAVNVLKEILGVEEVAILPPDDEILAHADGMVMWAGPNTLLVNDYADDPAFRTDVLTELTSAFPTVDIQEVPVTFHNNGWPGFESSCGINVNATLTFNNIYVPTFGDSHEPQFFQMLEASTDKNIVRINANDVCRMGGSVRCLTWQLAGLNAERLIDAARK